MQSRGIGTCFNLALAMIVTGIMILFAALATAPSSAAGTTAMRTGRLRNWRRPTVTRSEAAS
jgi:hypothetical protein